MLPYIELSEIDVTRVRSMEFDRTLVTIDFEDGSTIVIEYDSHTGMEYDYRDSDGKWFEITV